MSNPELYQRSLKKGSNMDEHPRSRGAISPGVCVFPSPKKGRGECRVPAAPAASRAKVQVAHEHIHHGYSRNHPAFPHAMVLTAYFVLSPVTGPSCHRHLRIKALYAPGRARKNLRKLDASVGASGPH